MKRQIKIYWNNQKKIMKLCRRLEKWLGYSFDYDGFVRQFGNIIGWKSFDSANNWVLVIK